jgi:hypothetical protein
MISRFDPDVQHLKAPRLHGFVDKKVIYQDQPAGKKHWFARSNGIYCHFTAVSKSFCYNFNVMVCAIKL